MLKQQINVPTFKYGGLKMKSLFRISLILLFTCSCFVVAGCSDAEAPAKKAETTKEGSDAKAEGSDTKAEGSDAKAEGSDKK